MKVKGTTELPFRRRAELKTNYEKRLAMIKSDKPRLVVRKTNTQIVVQIIKHGQKGDFTEATAVSSELKKKGWKNSTKSLPSAYLAGMMCGLRAKKKGIKEAIVDIGLNSPVHGSRIFSAVKGAVDSGLGIKVSEEALPKEERIKGMHISNDVAKAFDETKEKIKKEMS